VSDTYGSTPCPIREDPGRWDPAAVAALLETRDALLVRTLADQLIPIFSLMLALIAKGALSIEELAAAEQTLRTALAADPGGDP